MVLSHAQIRVKYPYSNIKKVVNVSRKSSRGQGNVPNENHEGSRSFKTFRKGGKRHVPSALFARPVHASELEEPGLDPIANASLIQRRKEVEDQKILTRNKNLSLIISVTHSVGFLTPIWVIFGTDHLGLSLTLSLILGSTGWVSSSIFEVPMGAFADKYGRKLSLLLGLGLVAVGDLSLVLLSHFWLLMAFQVLAGVGFSMRSGSLEGLLHDTYAAKEEHTAYSKLSSTMLFLVNFSRVVTVPIGAWLYNLDPKASLSSYTFPYIASVASFSVAIFCASFLVERRSSQADNELQTSHASTISSGLWQHVLATLRAMTADRDIKRVSVILGLYAFIGEGNWALYQSYFRYRNISLTNSGWIYTGIVFLMALGSLYVINVYKRLNVMWAMNLIILIVTFDIVLMHLPIYFAVFAFAVTAFISSMSWYLQDNAIQNRMVGDQKTTALSIASMIYNIGATIGIYGVGAIADRIGVLDAQWFFVGFGIVVFVGIGIWCWGDGFALRPEDARATGQVVIDLEHAGDEESLEVTPFDDVSQIKP